MKRVRTNGIELEYDEVGDGEPLLLIMGIAAQRIVWHEDFMWELAQSGFRVIRFDNRDVGGSSWMTGSRAPNPLQAAARAMLSLRIDAPYTLSDMASDVAGLIDALQLESAHLVGASMGGMIAQHVAIEHPGHVRSLTSIMSGPGTRRHMIGEPKAIRALLSTAPTTREEAADLNEKLFRAIGGELELDFNHVRERAAMSFDRHNPAGFPRQWAAMMASGSRLDKLAGVRVPTAVIHGSVDPLVPPRAGLATANAVPGATMVMIDKMGHAMPRSTWPKIISTIRAVAGT